MSLRTGGRSRGPYTSFNLGVAVGDDAATVAAQRRDFAEAIGARPVWLGQVHGCHVLRLDRDTPGQPESPADAAWTTEHGIACTVQAADCMPVLFALPDGRAVAAAHAGWRGLAGGVLESTLQVLCAGTGADPAELQVWLGPCIGPRQFEVDTDVVEAFDRAQYFVPRPRADGSMRWLADLPGLARERLRAAGLTQITGGQWCTVEDPSRFFSFRRDGLTGRMAAAVWMAPTQGQRGHDGDGQHHQERGSLRLVLRQPGDEYEPRNHEGAAADAEHAADDAGGETEDGRGDQERHSSAVTIATPIRNAPNRPFSSRSSRRARRDAPASDPTTAPPASAAPSS